MEIEIYDKFVNRHIGPDENEVREMLDYTGFDSLDELIDKTIPEKIRLEKLPPLPEAISEFSLLHELRQIGNKNKVFKSFIGMGYYPTITPAVIQRNVFENPGWYTQYTPYQAEISQGRLEALINFQTMVIDLTGLPIANASLLDEATSAAEAMSMVYHSRKPNKKNSNKFFVSADSFPQTIDVLKTRAEPLGIELIIDELMNINLTDDIFGVFVQYPSGSGSINDYSSLFNEAKQKDIFSIAAADLLSLTLIKSPGEMGADVAVGSAQRFGVPLGYGGPHAAYFACLDDFRRVLPGRIIGASVDAYGNTAYRMALQTREQHIRREKATSNICTAQVLLAIMASMYGVYHGPKGLTAIAERVHSLTAILGKELQKLGVKQLNEYFFDTLNISFNDTKNLRKIAESNNVNFRYGNNTVGISLDETTGKEDIQLILKIFSSALKINGSVPVLKNEAQKTFPDNLIRTSEFMSHPVFNKHHSETEMMRYIKKLENKDLSLTVSMIPLGSCTMKLNAATEMIPVSFPNFSRLHPFAPVNQTEGYQQIFKELESYLSAITGFEAVSLQPNSGAQGEYTGLLVIRKYHHSNKEFKRDVVLIPASAHGTNPASAVMAGLKVVVVKTTPLGDIDVDDLKMKAVQNKGTLASLMVTYPSTHGVFEENIKEICSIIHDYGGQVYMDGANMNAQIGLTSPANIGADVCHLNLHKTFCIPHGGGGPGMGPIAVAKHLAEFLPSHPVINISRKNSITAVSAAPWGSASILLISYAYIRMMGIDGLTLASKIAILNANYIKKRLQEYFPVLYTGKNDTIAHELIFDFRKFKASANIEITDIAKRLMDYGFHAPTVSFPVPGTLMVEPTESETKEEMDRFCDALISIKNEIDEVAEGKASKEDNVLKNSPHTSYHICSEEWNHQYSRIKAAYPLEYIKDNKFWPAVSRIDNAYGDRNFVCSCEPISSYEEA